MKRIEESYELTLFKIEMIKRVRTLEEKLDLIMNHLGIEVVEQPRLAVRQKEESHE